MRKMTAFVTLLVLLSAVGCADIKIGPLFGKGGFVSRKSDVETEDFQGHYLTVKIDGEKTDMADKVGGDQLWTIDRCSPNFTLEFKYDEDKLGKFNEVDVVINPMKGNAADHRVMYQCDPVRDTLKPGRKMRMTRFSYFHDGKLEKIRKLPAGKYRISVQVNGEKTWDRQYITVEIR